ncbi:glycosyltransferase family 9 protein [Pigmentiphaga soli]
MATEWRDAANVLCVRLDNLGDVLMSTPAMRALHAAVPGRRLTMLASPSGAALRPHLPFLERVIAYDAPWVKNARDDGPAADLALIERLRNGAFDAAVIFTVYSQSPLPAAMACRLAGIPRVLAHCRENPYRLLSDWVKEGGPEDDGRHEVQRQLDLVAAVGARADDARLAFEVLPADRSAVRALLASHGVPDASECIVVHPGASAPSRRYPPTSFAQAMRLLAAQTGAPLVVTGGPGERDLVAAVCATAAVPAIDLAGRLSLGQLGALLAEASVLVSNNSGPVHIAAAVGTPVVDLYALTNPQHAPWQVPHRLLYRDVSCKYCYRSVCVAGHHACLAGVDPAEVAHAAGELRAARLSPGGRRDAA